MSKKNLSWNANYSKFGTHNCDPVTCLYAKYCVHCIINHVKCGGIYNHHVTLCEPLNPDFLCIRLKYDKHVFPSKH